MDTLKIHPCKCERIHPRHFFFEKKERTVIYSLMFCDHRMNLNNFLGPHGWRITISFTRWRLNPYDLSLNCRYWVSLRRWFTFWWRWTVLWTVPCHGDPPTKSHDNHRDNNDIFCDGHGSNMTRVMIINIVYGVILWIACLDVFILVLDYQFLAGR